MSSTCQHLESLTPSLQAPRHGQAVGREECSQCFDRDTDSDGIHVCLSCFSGGCPRLHAQAHADKFPGHPVALAIRKTRKPASSSPASNKRASGEPPAKRLAIREEAPEHEKYDFHTSLICYGCGGQQIAGNEKTDGIVAAILASTTMAQQSEVKAWEEEIESCKHSKELVQEASKQLEQSGLAHCSRCELNNNLWLCLTCGSLSCGRQQFGGLGGNGHALVHFETTQHPISVKLGTIQPDGSADIYCYACNDARLDAFLKDHLSHFGINVDTQTKTEKSMTELQVEQNLKFDFAMTGEDGKDLEPLFGPGLTGLANLGNSCYMASVLQSLFSLPQFADRYFTKGSAHSLLCQNPDPASCFECQMSKIADGLLSGRYAVPRAADSAANDDATAEHYATAENGQPISTGEPVKSDTKAFQEGVRPAMFKALVGKNHEEFKTMRQQDAEEFFRHLVGMIQKESRNAGAVGGTMLDDEGSRDPTEIFQFEMEEKLQCNECKGVRYKTVPEETLSLPVPFVEKKTADSAMDIDTTESKGKGAIEGVNAEPAATSASTAKSDDKQQWESVTVEECLKLLTNITTIEYKCPKCEKNVFANKSTKFSSFPNTLVVHAQKFRLHNWVPQKVDVPIVISADSLSLDTYMGTGKLDSEELLPEEEAPAAPALEFNAAAMAQLEGMGFPSVRCQRALLATGNSDPEAAMNWLFMHMEDADIDEPISAAQLAQASGSASAAGASSTGSTGPSAEQISMVSEMGFTAAQARKALRQTGGSIEGALEWLFSHPDDQGEEEGAVVAESAETSSGRKERGSKTLPAQYRLKAFISHKGSSVHTGHYVAHIHYPEHGWVLFNDEKVVSANGGAQAAEALMPFAYLYIFEKIDASPAA